MKFIVSRELGPMRISQRVEGDKLVILVDCDVRTEVQRVSDQFSGPSVETVESMPGVYLVHGAKEGKK